jgi:hypothetical protein
MTRTQELLEAVRVKLGGVTDYRMAITLGIPRPRIHEYVKGKAQADAYASTRIALELDRDPLEVIAEVEAEAARSPTVRSFWASFASGHLLTATGAAFLGMSCFFADAPTASAATEGGSHNVRLRQRKPRKISPIEKPRRYSGLFFRMPSVAAGRDRRRPGRPA